MHNNLVLDTEIIPGMGQTDDIDSRYVDSYWAGTAGGGVIWFDGRSATGKTTIANAVQQHKVFSYIYRANAAPAGFKASVI